MARYFIRKRKETNECDCCPDVGYNYSDLSIGIGPVNPLGGPDKFDVINTKVTKRKKRKIRK